MRVTWQRRNHFKRSYDVFIALYMIKLVVSSFGTALRAWIIVPKILRWYFTCLESAIVPNHEHQRPHRCDYRGNLQWACDYALLQDVIRAPDSAEKIGQEFWAKWKSKLGHHSALLTHSGIFSDDSWTGDCCIHINCFLTSRFCRKISKYYHFRDRWNRRNRYHSLSHFD